MNLNLHIGLTVLTVIIQIAWGTALTLQLQKLRPFGRTVTAFSTLAAAVAFYLLGHVLIVNIIGVLVTFLMILYIYVEKDDT